MATQTQGINVQHLPDTTGYRLIELPPELQSHLESDTPPVSVPSPQTILSPSSHPFACSPSSYHTA